MPAIRTDETYVELVTFETDDADGQQRLLDALSAQVNDWVRRIPGFISANFHVSNDGRKLFNYAQWESRDAWELFGADDRRVRIREAVKAAGARHTRGQGYQVACVIEPASGEVT